MKNKSCLPVLLVTLTVVSVLSCHKGDLTPSGPDIYVAGVTGVSPNIQAVYWKNGVATELKTPDNAYCFANDIVVVGTDVYVSGGYYNSSYSPTPVYWKNGVMVKLSDEGSALAITSSGTDILIGGYANGVGGYWQNGNFIQFDNSTGVSDIVVSGTDVHAVGLYETSTSITPLYWKNNVVTNLPGPTEPFRVSAGSTGVYICCTVPGQYRVNGTQVAIPDAQILYAITTSGSDVYLSGLSAGTTGYWKNGVFSKADSFGYPTSIRVSGTDVYMVGYSNDPYALLWKNGVSTKLTGSSPSRASGLFIN